MPSQQPNSAPAPAAAPPPPRDPLPPGIWAPTQVFFTPSTSTHSETIDLPTTATHAVRLARAGVAGLVTNGSNGEAAHLTPQERASVTRTTRAALDAAGFAHVPVLAGASDASLRGTLVLAAEARAAGADAVLVLCPSAFRWAMGDVEVVVGFFRGVVEGCGGGPGGGKGQGGLPVVVYNYPAAAGGLDLDSDLLGRLAEVGVAGVKFTCGNVGKLARVASLTAGREGGGFRCFSGVADAIVPALAVGGHGGIVGAANVFPRACVQVYRLFQEGRWEEVRIAQQRLALADWAMTKRAIPGFKSVLQKYHGYGGIPRLPVLPLSEEEEGKLFAEIEEMMRVEAELEDFGTSSH
ncbi:dihydrodipicolinate synthetase family protein [Chaetomium sp. MPI-CAGE-AT-0009]|nr:dihydrodipicolinate synthetase family protein [Chaetomium sp. MPI-CAGE-AT-0009]